ncbi:hypothetical protein MM236_13580 [Belliella sp. DSM 107340]|uniref:VanZ-like domain-containing protein n=1 Tax=Belliella calami TaxID=2923436 RepID=A0ABS9URI5_9BACT|nr:hypothetical protein [Belliella calami]MCH7399030.1 hypothetical protein [Belliella calami]
MMKNILCSPKILHFKKIFILYLIGYFLASHYRSYQNSHSFFDFGLADSGVGLVSIIIVYLIFTPPSKSRMQARKILFLVLFAYLSQEIYCYFFPGFVGTFDFKDMIYYVLGFVFVYWFDVKRRRVI